MLTLIRKEFAEHGFVLLLILPTTLFGFLLCLAFTLSEQTQSGLDSVRFFSLSFLLILEMMLCNRLVVQEYSGKTQLFLESLPISRFTMLASKYLIGFLVTSAVAGATFVIALAVASRSEALDVTFVGLMATRLLVYVFLTFSFFFMMGLLGRYRIAIYIAIAIAWFTLTSKTQFDSTVFGPSALMNDQFAYERLVAPVQNLVLCAITGAIFCLAAAGLAMVREGSVAGLMAEKMSYREKLFLFGTLFAVTVGMGILDSKQQPEPYAIAGAVVRQTGDVQVQVGMIERADVAEQLAGELASDLSTIADQLKMNNQPALFVVNRTDLDADQFEIANLTNASGALMRLNFASPDWSYPKVRPIVIDHWLSLATRYNAVEESRCWVLEGFSEYWPRQRQAGQDGSGATDWNAESLFDMRAAYAGSVGFAPDDVDDWYSFRERLGQSVIRSVACSGLVLAERRHGPEKVQLFLQAILGGNQPSDFRSDLHRWIHPIDRVWRDTIGSDYEDFKTAWADELKSLGSDWNEPLASVPRLSADGSFQAESPTSYRLDVTAACDNSPPATFSIIHQTLDVFDAWENDQETLRQDESWTDQTVSVDRLFSRGGRLRWTIAADSPALDCEVISGWKRTEVQ